MERNENKFIHGTILNVKNGLALLMGDEGNYQNALDALNLNLGTYY